MNPIPIDRTHGGAAPEGVLDFSASINPLGPPPAAIEAYHAAVARIVSYPPARSVMLESRLAEWMRIRPETVLAANGTTQLLYLLAKVLEPARAFVVIPTFSEIANALAGEGLPPEPIQLARECDYRFDPGQIEVALAAHASAILFGRPNSPTSTTLTIDQVSETAARCDRRGCWCVVDEAFIDFCDDPVSAVSLLVEHPRLIVLRSLTKSFAIPGLRLGCVVADAEIVTALRNAIEPWSVNVVAESVGIACLRDAADYLARTRVVVAEERAYLTDSLGRVAGLRVFPSAANFLMFEIADESTGGEFGQWMLTQGIAVRDLQTMAGCEPGLYRIGLRNHADNQRLVGAVGRWRSHR